MFSRNTERVDVFRARRMRWDEVEGTRISRKASEEEKEREGRRCRCRYKKTARRPVWVIRRDGEVGLVGERRWNPESEAAIGPRDKGGPWQPI